MNSLRRLGGMVSAPRATLRAIATSHAGDVLEPILLWAAIVLVLHGRDVFRLVSLIGQATSTVLRRLFDLLVGEGRNDFALLAVVAVALALFGRYVAKRRIALGAGATAATYLLVPLVVMKAAGGLLSLAGLDLWWLPHWPVDSYVVFVGGKVSWLRFAVKCAVAYGPSLVLLVDLVVYLWKPAPITEVAPWPSPMRLRAGLGALSALLAVTAIGSVADVVAKREQLKPAVPGAALPTTSLAWLTARPTDPKGRLDLASLQGKVVVLDFWASWCAPCRRSIPELSALQQELGPRGLVVLGVNREPYDVPAAKQAFTKLNPSFQSVVDDRAYGERVGLTSLPTTILVDQKGVVRGLHLGYTEPAIVRAEVLRLLEGT